VERIEPRGGSSGALILFLSLALSLCVAACDSGPDWGMPPASKNRPNPVPAGQNLASAQLLYADRCARCHGEEGAGDGSDAKLYKPLPSSLVSDQVRQSTDGELFWKISKGRRPMPGYEGELSEQQRWELVNLLRSFAPKGDAAEPASTRK
jgi:mono/diheme cytochrome c family protein